MNIAKLVECLRKLNYDVELVPQNDDFIKVTYNGLSRHIFIKFDNNGNCLAISFSLRNGNVLFTDNLVKIKQSINDILRLEKIQNEIQKTMIIPQLNFLINGERLNSIKKRSKRIADYFNITKPPCCGHFLRAAVRYCCQVEGGKKFLDMPSAKK